MSTDFGCQILSNYFLFLVGSLRIRRVGLFNATTYLYEMSMETCCCCRCTNFIVRKLGLACFIGERIRIWCQDRHTYYSYTMYTARENQNTRQENPIPSNISQRSTPSPRHLHRLQLFVTHAWTLLVQPSSTSLLILLLIVYPILRHVHVHAHTLLLQLRRRRS